MAPPPDRAEPPVGSGSSSPPAEVGTLGCAPAGSNLLQARSSRFQRPPAIRKGATSRAFLLQAPALHRATLPAAASSTSGHSEFRPEAMLELRDSKQELILKVQAMKKVRAC